MYKVNDVACYFLSRGSISNKKLQKLVYYAYAWTLTLLNEKIEDISFRLFLDRIEAWIHGPVIPELYKEYKAYGWDNIPMKDDFNQNIFAPDVLDILNQVWNIYGSFSADELEVISHREKPWINARGDCKPFETCNIQLSDKDIFEFYLNMSN